MAANPTEDLQLNALRAHTATVARVAQAAAGMLHSPDADQWPTEARGIIAELIECCAKIYDVGAINPRPKASDDFWSHVRRPYSESAGLLAPCWVADYARLKDPNGTPGIAVKHWRGKMRPAHHVAWELLHGAPLPEGDRLRRKCATKNCVNVDNHYEHLHGKLESRRLAEPEFAEMLEQAASASPQCRNGHFIGPGKSPRNCSKCRIERRKRKEARRAAAWRATYYGEIGGPTPPDHAEGAGRADSFVPEIPEGLPGSESRPLLETEPSEDIDAAIRAMFAPTAESARILAIHERSKLGT